MLVVFEALHIMNSGQRRGDGKMALKLDTSKVYDCERPQPQLVSLNFEQNLCKWVRLFFLSLKMDVELVIPFPLDQEFYIWSSHLF